MVSAANTATAIDERIEHQIEKLVGELESHRLRAGRGFAGKLVQRVSEIAAGQAEERHEGRRQRAAVVEEVVDGMTDVNPSTVKGGSGADVCGGKGGSPGTGGIVVGGVGVGVGGCQERAAP